MKGLSFDICSYLVGLSGGIGFGGLVQTKLYFLVIKQNWSKLWDITLVTFSTRSNSHTVAIFSLNEAVEVLVNAHVVGFLKF